MIHATYMNTWYWYNGTGILLYAVSLFALWFGDVMTWSARLRILIVPAFLVLLMNIWKLGRGLEWLDGKPYVLHVDWVRLHLLLSLPGFIIPFVWPTWERWTTVYWLSIVYMIVYICHSLPPFIIALWRLWRLGSPHAIKKQPWALMPVVLLLDLQIIPLTALGGAAGLGMSFLIHQLPLFWSDIVYFLVVDRGLIYPHATIHTRPSMCPMRLVDTWSLTL